MDGLKIFSERLKMLRLERGLTQREMAESVGLTAASLSAYENGTKTPSLGVAIDIADKYAVSLDWLVGTTRGFLSAERLSDYENALNSFIFFFDQCRMMTVNIVEDNAELIIDSDAFNRFVIQAYQLQHLYWAGTMDADIYIDCVQNLIRKYAKTLFAENDSSDKPGLVNLKKLSHDFSDALKSLIE